MSQLWESSAEKGSRGKLLKRPRWYTSAEPPRVCSQVAQEAKWNDTFGVPSEYAPRDKIGARDFLRALKPLVTENSAAGDPCGSTGVRHRQCCVAIDVLAVRNPAASDSDQQ